jgi:hypothetical protein
MATTTAAAATMARVSNFDLFLKRRKDYGRSLGGLLPGRMGLSPYVVCERLIYKGFCYFIIPASRARWIASVRFRAPSFA